MSILKLLCTRILIRERLSRYCCDVKQNPPTGSIGWPLSTIATATISNALSVLPVDLEKAEYQV